MTELRVFLAFAAVCVVALWYVSRGVLASLAPLCAVATAALWFSLCGCFGLLRLGGWVFYAFAAILVLYLLYTHGLRRRPFFFFGYGFWFFLLAGVVMLVMLWAKQPMFTTWDEFSFWGTAHKLAKLYGQLYTTAPVGWAWPATQTPALIAFGYLFQFFGKGFVEWQAYAATDIFMLAAMAALLAPFEKKDWPLALPTALAALLAPFVFTYYMSATSVSSVYADTLADIPMGLGFAAVLACYYADDHKLLADMVPVCLALACLTLTKDIGVSLALVAAVIIGIDYIFVPRPDEQAPEDTGTIRRRILTPTRLRGGLARLGLGLGTVVAAFAGWAFYLGRVSGVSRANSLGGIKELGMADLPLAFLNELFSSEKSEVFRFVTSEMPRRFFSIRINMIGSGFVNTVLILAMLGLAVWLATGGAARLRVILFAVLSTLGFLAYSLLIAMSYIYIMRPEQAYGFDSHERYMYPYYMAWFLAAFVLMCAAARGRQGLWLAAGRLAPAGLAALLFLRVALMVPPQLTLFGVHREEYSLRRQQAAYLQSLCSPLPRDARTFLVYSGDSGIGWLTYCYEFLPWQLDYSYGGGQQAVREKQPDGTTLVRPVTRLEWERHLVSTGCDVVLIVDADEDFRQKFAYAFTDRLQDYDNGLTQYYQVNVNGERITLSPVRDLSTLQSTTQ